MMNSRLKVLYNKFYIYGVITHKIINFNFKTVLELHKFDKKTKHRNICTCIFDGYILFITKF